MLKDSLISVADILVVVEALAILAFAISGLLEAARKGLDVVGVCMVAGLAAFGGGTMRDILLDRRPFFLGRARRLAVDADAARHRRHAFHACPPFRAD